MQFNEREHVSDGTASLPRREAIASLGFAAMALAGAGLGLNAEAFGQDVSTPIRVGPAPMSLESLGWDPKTNQYVLPPLPYKYDALEPHIDKQTMELHHDKHHASYVTGLNRAIAALKDLRKREPEATEVRNWIRELAFHGSGHFLHVLFWNSMGPASASGESSGASTAMGGQPKGELAKQIDKDFGSFKQFSDQFQSAAVAVEGGGWGIVAWEPISRQLLIMQAEKHQNLTAWGVQPVLPLDVWEHAYYLKYQNKRKDYVGAFMNVINWDAVDRRFADVSRAASR